jgi:hypothetical protein
MLRKPLASPALQPGHKTKSPVLRLASLDDYDQIAALGAANGLTTKSREQWLHLWRENPAYQQLPGWPIGWVLEDEDGRIVGSLENLPCLYRFGGRTYVGAFGRGWVVNIGYRVFALQLLARQLRQSHVDLHVTNTASPRASLLLTLKGWSPVPAGEWDRSALWVASYAQTVRSYLAAKMPRPVSALAGPVLYPPLLLRDLVSRSRRGFKIGCKLGWNASFDERFDRFWAELENRNPRVLLSVRTRQTLHWHFKYALEQNRIWILTASDGPRLLAYAIIERRETRVVGIKRVLLIDFQTLDSDRVLTSAMISCILERCRREYIHVLENFGCWLEKRQPLVHRAPHCRDLGTWCYLYRAANHELSGALKSAESWYPTLYDADASL